MALTATAFGTLHSRSLSTDNTINVTFGILASILGILSVMFAWAMWQSSRRLEGRGPRDDSKCFSESRMAIVKFL